MVFNILYDLFNRVHTYLGMYSIGQACNSQRIETSCEYLNPLQSLWSCSVSLSKALRTWSTQPFLEQNSLKQECSKALIMSCMFLKLSTLKLPTVPSLRRYMICLPSLYSISSRWDMSNLRQDDIRR